MSPLLAILEDIVEEAAILWLQELGFQYLHGNDIAPDGPSKERDSYADVILEGRFKSALSQLNSHLDSDVLDDVARRVLRPASPSLEESNHAFHQMLTKGVEVQVRKDDQVRGDLAQLIDFSDPENNDWLVVNQFTVIDGKNNRRPDVVVFVNGLPLAVIELKNPEDRDATINSAWNQLQTYKKQISALFNTNEILVISDGIEAKVGSLTAGFERFSPWRTIDSSELAPDSKVKMEVVLKGLFDKARFLDYIRNFIVWETDDGYIKKLAGYHQYHATNKAEETTLVASGVDGDKRIGVVWHTQGSGKSLSMIFLAAKLIQHPEMRNPTIVVLTDRNDLDGQLFTFFAAASDLVRAYFNHRRSFLPLLQLFRD